MYETILKSYLANINTLRVFVSGVELSLEKNEKEVFTTHYRELVPIALAFHKADPNKFKLSDNMFDELSNVFKDKVEVEIKDEDDISKGFTVLIQGDTKTDVAIAMKKIKLHHSQINMLYQNSLINLIVFFELLISRVLHTHITKYPETSIKDKTLSLEEIRKLGSFSDAEKYLIDQEVEGIMYGSLDKWYKYLTDKIKITLPYFDKNRELINEVFQRRNIVVHNDGIVNSIYLKNVKEELRSNIANGGKINIDREYINNSISLIENVGSVILLEMWKKAEKKSQHRIEVIMNEGYVLMQEQNWKLAGTLYDFVTNEQGTLVEDKIISKVNFWQCMKWSNQFNKIKDEVAEADFSAYNRKFQLSLLALKNDNDKFFELLEKALPHDITVDDLKKWPIFSEIRETEEYKKLIQTIEEPPLEVEFTDILKKIETYEEQVQELAAKDEDKKDEN